MREEHKTKVVEYTTYIADDGTEFTSNNSCRLYEWRQQAGVIYAVTCRGQQAEHSEIYPFRYYCAETTR